MDVLEPDAPPFVEIIHLSGDPISKYDLLKIIAKQYNKKIKVEPNVDVKIDRSLNSNHFKNLTGYKSEPWPLLVKSMEEFNLLSQ